MNRLYKRFGAGTMLATLIISATPNAVIALASPTAHAAAASNSGYCNSLPGKVNGVTGRLQADKTKVQSAWSSQDAKLKSLADATDKKVADARAQAATTRQAEYAQLMAKATTDSQKQAVTTYQNSVNGAVQARQAAYDAARAAFKAGVVQTITARRTSLSGQVTSFVTSATNAVNAAETSCDNGVAAATVRATLLASLKSARQTFVAERKDDSKVRDQVKTLAATRNAAFKAADAQFKIALQAANSTLKTAFGSDASNI